MSAKLPEFPKEHYPDDLELKLLQIVHRHGERAPVRRRLEKIVPAVWNLCDANASMFATIAEFNRQKITHHHVPVERVLETDTTESKQVPVPSGGCYYGQLTTLGRYRMHTLGQHLRAFYIDKLKFLPDVYDEESTYLRSSDYPRTQESIQQFVGGGLYPQDKRPMDFTGFRLWIRDPRDDLMFPNPMCYKLRSLSKQFTQKVAELTQEQCKSISDRLRDHVEDVSLTSHPSANGILDTLIAAKVHGYDLPQEMDDQLLRDLEDVVVKEWFYGAMVSADVRRLGLGRLMGMIRDRMVRTQEQKEKIKLAVYSGHDTTVGPLLILLNAFDQRWPPFGSAVLFELFQQTSTQQHFVRVKYNENTLTLPGCQLKGNHKEGDPTLCTLEAFKAIVQDQIPMDWEKECNGV